MPDFLGWKRLDGEGDGLDELGDDIGVDGVGFGELSVGFGEVADAFGFDDGDLDAGLLEGDGDGEFEAAGGFESDADVGGFGGERQELQEELSVSGRRVFDAQGLAEESDGDIEVGFRDIDADEESGHGRTFEGERMHDRDRPKLLLANTGSWPW